MSVSEPTNIALPLVERDVNAPESTVKASKIKSEVLTIGAKAEEIKTAIQSFYLASALYTKAETKPAAIAFIKHTSTVKIALFALSWRSAAVHKSLLITALITVIAPKTAPVIIPPFIPTIAPHKIIGVRASVKLTPTAALKLPAKNCKTITSAEKIAISVKSCVFELFLFVAIIKSS